MTRLKSAEYDVYALYVSLTTYAACSILYIYQMGRDSLDAWVTFELERGRACLAGNVYEQRSGMNQLERLNQFNRCSLYTRGPDLYKLLTGNN